MSENTNSRQLLSGRNFNYLFTFGTEFLILFIGILLFKIVAVKFGTDGFAEFAVGKRLFGFLIPLLMVGMGVSLPKFLPVADSEKQNQIYYTSLIIVTVLSALALLLVTLGDDYFSRIIFGDQQHQTLLFYMVLYVFSMLVNSCMYNYFRGKLDFIYSGSLQFITLGIFPLLVYFLTSTMETYFLYLFLLTISVNIGLSLWKISFINLTKDILKETARKILVYGIQRTPGDIVLGLFFALPTFFIAGHFSLVQAGNVAFCLSLFNMVIAVMSPVNIILLPTTAQIIHEKRFARLKEISKKLFLLSLLVGVFTLLGTYFLGSWALGLFEISDVEETTKYLFIIFSGVVGYSIFSVIRSIIDAYYHTARVSLLILISFGLFAILLGILFWTKTLSITNILITFSVSMNLLGILCGYHLIKINKSPVS